MGFLSSILGNIFGGGGGNPSDTANKQLAQQQPIIDRMLAKGATYDPIQLGATNQLKSRAESAPFYATDWLKQAQGLRSGPRTLDFSQGQQSKDPSGAHFNPMAMSL